MRTAKIVYIAQILCYLSAAIWLILGIISLGKLQQDQAVPVVVLFLMAVMMLINAAVFMVSGYGLGKRNRWLYYLGLAVVSVNLVLTVTDQVGFYDWIVLVINVVLLVLLVAARKEFR